MTTTAVQTQIPSAIKRMTKAQILYAFYKLHMDAGMTKQAMLEKVATVLNPEVAERVKRGGEY